MKILFCIVTHTPIGNPTMGSERAMLSTAYALGDRGHTVDINNVLQKAPDWFKNYDIVHLWNAAGEKGPYNLVTQMAHQLKIPVVFTPIYWPTTELEEQISLVLGEGHKMGFQDYLKKQSPMFSNTDLLLPNSEGEMEKLVELLDGKTMNYRVVPNAVNVESEIEPTLKEDMEFPPDLENMLKERFVLSVGRIEVRKNQHRLVEAMDILWKDDPELQLILIGKKTRPYIDLLAEKVAEKNIIIGEESPPKVILALIKRASVCALFSWVETPSLFNLEAAALGTPIAVADRGSVREYFGDEAFYGDPTDPTDMAKAIKGALAKKTNPELANKVLTEYSHTRAAELTEKAYEELISVYRND